MIFDLSLMFLNILILILNILKSCFHYLKGSKESSITVHDDESEPVVICEQSTQSFCVELVVTEIERSVDCSWEVSFNMILSLPLKMRSYQGQTIVP
jgi:hypothetical protein